MTSFTGEDMLTTVLRAGNYGESTFGNGLTFMETASATSGKLTIDRLFYTFPVGEDLTVTAGPIVRTDDAGMYAGYATYYPADLMLDFFTYGGAWSTNTLTGAGAGLGAVYSINDSGFSVSGNYVSRNGAKSDAGIGTDESQFTSSWQLFYEGELFDGGFLAQVGYSVNRGVGYTMSPGPTFTDSSSEGIASKEDVRPFEADIPSSGIFGGISIVSLGVTGADGGDQSSISRLPSCSQAVVAAIGESRTGIHGEGNATVD
jgi:hypothetical protein